MENFLIQHALDNVWCSPEQDRQFFFEPARLTYPRGVTRTVTVEWEQYALPDLDNAYHVFQLGQIAPVLLNLLPTKRRWFSGTDGINNLNVLLGAYTLQGRFFPAYDCFIQLTENKNLILAIKDRPRVGDAGTERIFVRFYSNAYFSSARRGATTQRLRAGGRVSNSRQDSVNLQTEVANIGKNLTGIVNVYVNGWLVDAIKPDLIQPGDTVEYVQDTSVREVFAVSVSTLATFTSALDNVRKYFLPRGTTVGDTIDFHDDIDIYIYRSSSSVPYQGVFYHRPNFNAVRMVTHRDYSIPVQNVLDAQNRIAAWVGKTDLKIRVTVRNSGYKRSLIDEHHRIEELYRLTATQLKTAVTGSNTIMDLWQAASLEASAYPAIMRQKSTEPLSIETVKDAYGYNSISTLVGRCIDPVVRDANNKLSTTPPYAMRESGTFFEYSASGALISAYYVANATKYLVTNTTAALVENIVGQGTTSLQMFYNTASVTVGTSVAYDVFIGNKTAPYNWRKGVLDQDYQIDGDGVLTWIGSTTNINTVVQFYTTFYYTSFSASTAASGSGYIYFTIAPSVVSAGTRKTQNMLVPFGRLDVFLNGKCLIEGIDYTVQWPNVMIFNKQWINQASTTQNVKVRAYGPPDNQGNRLPGADFGFVKRGLLSDNTRFDVRDDRNVRCVVNGGIVPKSTLAFSESHNGVRYAAPDGTPYVIDDVVVPMYTLPNTDTYEFRQRSRDVDKKVGDYLTQYYPDPVQTAPLNVTSKYVVYSPFLARVHNLLASNYLYPTEIKGQYSDEDIRRFLAPYEFLLTFDPAQLGFDSTFVRVDPHVYGTVKELDFYQYEFFRRTAALYFADKVDITALVKVKEA